MKVSTGIKMITQYKNHTITVTREKSMGGDVMLYYSIFRDSDGYECTSGFLDSSDSVKSMTKHLKNRIDAELKDPDPWGENSN